MADFQYIWAIVTGVLSILAMIPLAVRYINSQLPTKKLQPMFELLGDANSLLLSCVEEGLVYGRKAQNYETTLSQLRSKAEDARLRATSAKTYYEDLANWWKGLTQSIGEICMNVRDVRADISSNSLRERERLDAQRRASMAWAANGEQVAADDPSASTSSITAALSDVAVTHDFVDPTDASAPTVSPQHHATHTSSVSGTRDVSLFLRLSPDSSSETLVTPSTPSSIAMAPTSSHHDRRCSVFSASYSNSSMKSVRVRLKRGGNPLSRARIMARFVRQARATRSGLVFIVDPHRLTALELAGTDDDEDDGDWVDEQAVLVVAHASSAMPVTAHR
ncbi:hypothetical protein K466DRAFT_664142 [Polyporus arcularius HHB13444]|uniref:Uncharacterized protein n=1 Tax=Polyporus arcularius HHB13444 TaxID=1314778 RepID=A0A5C3P8E6_9APHY|nr:hypothetical protein K466DRAFT_664142 [Polyporus arcularius HHB13444]